MSKKLRTSTLFLSGTLLGISLAVGTSVFALKDENKQIPFEDLQAFTEVFSKVKSDYVETVDDKKLIEDCGVNAKQPNKDQYLVLFFGKPPTEEKNVNTCPGRKALERLGLLN